MITGWETLLLIVLVAIGWFWFDSLKAREAAIAAARAACESEGALLLDWTVANMLTKFARNENGRVQLRRTYAFEYTNTGNNRLRGSVALLGREVLLLSLAQ